MRTHSFVLLICVTWLSERVHVAIWLAQHACSTLLHVQANVLVATCATHSVPPMQQNEWEYLNGT
jgi:hypothetical protein